MLDPGQLLGRAELAPPDARLTVEHERGVRPPLPHTRLLQSASLLGRVAVRPALLVKAQAPAAVPDTVMILGQPREVRPGGHVEWPDGERHLLIMRTQT